MFFAFFAVALSGCASVQDENLAALREAQSFSGRAVALRNLKTADLEAAEKRGLAGGDEEGADCWRGLLDNPIAGADLADLKVAGLADAHELRRLATGNSFPPQPNALKKIKRACAAMILSDGEFWTKFLVAVGLARAGGPAVAGIAGGVNSVLSGPLKATLP